VALDVPSAQLIGSGNPGTEALGCTLNQKRASFGLQVAQSAKREFGGMPRTYKGGEEEDNKGKEINVGPTVVKGESNPRNHSNPIQAKVDRRQSFWPRQEATGKRDGRKLNRTEAVWGGGRKNQEAAAQDRMLVKSGDPRQEVSKGGETF